MPTSKKDTTSPPSLSRYQRVKNILTAAQGSTIASYQGYGSFWDLPLDDFKNAVVYGVRLIAESGNSPQDDDDCGDCDCGCCDPKPKDDDSASAKHPCLGRGAASGLIKGLKGEAPFDGSQFPRLLWGSSATPVAAADIQFIQDWIDDCCPENDEQATDLALAQTQRKNLAYGNIPHPLTTKPLNAHKGSPGQPRVRKNIDSLTPDELARFRAAVAKMQCLDQYPQDERSFAYWAKMHADMCQHGWEQFLTWHRAYLYFFEQRLQDIDPTVTLPYWDWTLSATQNQNATKSDSGIIPERYGCWMDEDGLANLKGNIAEDTWNKLNTLKKGKVYYSGNRLYEAAGIKYKGAAPQNNPPSDDDKIMTELQCINPLWHRQRWPNNFFGGHYPTPDDVERILERSLDFATLGGGPSSNHYFGALENIHNTMHLFSGGANPNYDKKSKNPEYYLEPEDGHMTDNRVTAYDPIFWAHHCNIDRLFAEWQGRHPGVNPQVLNSPLTPFEMIVSDTLSTDDLGYEYMQDAYHFETDNTQGLVQLDSQAAPVPKHVLKNHRRVEIRLHKVQVAERSANIRVFVNQPDATVDTPIEGNEHYVGNFVTFVGFCYGGPGHCAVPPERQRPYDMRMRHHKTPGNIRFDATEAVQKLIGKHKSDKDMPLSVHLVVTDTHGETREDLLKMDGISINFI